MADGTLQFSTKIDTKGFEQGVEDLKKKGNQATRSLDNGLDSNQKSLLSLSNVAKVVGTYISADIFKDALSKGVQFNAQVEQYTIALTTLTGSAEEADRIIAQVKEDAAKTPFNVSELVKGNQLLISTGLSAEDSRKTILALGDAISATGGGNEELSRMLINLQQIKNAGEASALDIRQFAYAGIDVYGLLADYLGITKEEASEMDVTFEDLSGALIKASQEGGKYFNAMTDQSETLNGQLSNLEDNLENRLGQAFMGVNDILKNDLIPSINSFLSGEIDFDTFVNQMVGIGSKLVTSLGNSIASNAPKLIDKGFELVKNLSEGIEKNLPNFLSDFLTFLQNVGNWLSEQAPTWIQKGFEILSNLVQGIIDSLPVMISQLPQVITTFANIINDNFPTILAKGAELLWQLVLGLLSAIPTLVANIPQIIEAIWSTFLAFNWLQIGTKIVEFIGQGLKSLVSIFTNTFNSIKTTITNIWNSVLNLFSSGGKIFSGLKEGIASVFKTIVNSLISGINKVIAIPFKTINGLLNTIRNASFLGISPFKGLWSQNPLPVPKIPKLEKGGILRKGQVGLLEGNGAEAVVPLDRNKYWVKAVAKEFARIMPQTITNNKEQIVNFYSTVASPDEVSRKMRNDKRLGLVG